MRQLLAGITLGAVVALVVLLATCAAAPTPSPVNTTTESTQTAEPLQESTRTVDTSTAVTEEHNPSKASCIVCHLRPASHGIDPFTCAECHTYDDWHTAEHPASLDCRSCHGKPAGHTSTAAQCSSCHKNAGVNWRFQHPSSTDCADCHTAPKPHYGTNCNACHSPSVPFGDTKYAHSDGLDCTDCHQRPHRSYPASCSTCHPSAGESWRFAHPKDSDCTSCHTPPSNHYTRGCAVCHTPGEKWQDASIIHDATTSDCISCHTPPHRGDYPVVCSSCHPAAGVAWLPPTHTGSTACASCHTAPVPHYGTNCVACHNPSVPFADSKIAHGPEQSACQDCHTPPHKAYPVACATCHQNAGTSWAVTHPATTSDCASCHTPPHRADYPVGCTSCHTQTGVTWVPPVHTDSTACASCHTAPMPHYGTNCAACHSPSVPFADATIAHGPEQTACQDCHTPPHTAYTPTLCAECHTQAGVAWTPITHPTRTDCATCHTRPIGHPAGECSTCHTPTIPWADTQHPGATSPCLSCHTPPHRADYPVACASCHPQVGVAWAPPVHTDSTACADCHDAPAAHYGTNCNACHDPSVPFADTAMVHGPDQTACLECHTPPHRTDYPVGCTSCHPLVGVAWVPPVHTDSTACSACHTRPIGHPAGECSTCHTPTIPWADTQHPGATSPCLSCHDPYHPSYEPSICSDCHQQVGVAWSPTSHVTRTDCQACHYPPPSHYGTNCSTCHELSVPFAEATMVHGPDQTACLDCHTPPHRADYPVACTSCHPQVGTTWVPPVHTDSTACASCHTPPASHYGTNCDACHSPSVPFANATIAHGPEQTACQDCHTPPHRDYAPTLCATCHEKAGVSWAVTHPATTSDCASCHTPTDHPMAGITCEGCHGVYHNDGNCEECHDAHGTEVIPGSTCSTCHGLSAPTLSSAVGYDNVLFSWTSVTSGATYEIQRATDAGFTTDRTVIYTGPWATQATDSDPALLPGTTYYYRVHVTLTDGSTGAWSNTSSAILTAMTTPVATPRAGGWDLVWSGGQPDFTLMVNGSPAVAMGAARAYYFVPATPGVYELAVRDGLGRLSGAVTATTAGYTSSMTQPTVTAEAGAYRLQWSGGAEPYTVLVDDTATATASTPSYLFDPTKGTYSIVVRDADGERTDPVAVVDSTEITFTPPAEKSPSGYLEYDPATAETTSTTSTQSVDTSGPAPAPLNGGDAQTQAPADEAPANDAPAKKTTQSPLPAAPHGFKASARGEDAALSWKAEQNVDYEVQQGDSADFSGAKRVWSGSGSGVDLGPFSAGEDVWFRVRALAGHDGETGPWSAAIGLKFPDDDEAPAPPLAPNTDARVPEDESLTLEAESASPSDPEQPTVEPQPVADTAAPEPSATVAPPDPPPDDGGPE